MITNVLLTGIMLSTLPDGMGQMSRQYFYLRANECYAIHHTLHMQGTHPFDSVMDTHSNMGSLE